MAGSVPSHAPSRFFVLTGGPGSGEIILAGLDYGLAVLPLASVEARVGFVVERIEAALKG